MIPGLRSHWRRAALVALLLAVIHTWPLATAPGEHSLNYNGDVMLNEWIVAWVQHQLPRNPLSLFQANIFHPAPDALAFSEPLIAPALLGAPIRILGGSPVLVHNLLLIGGLALTMLGGYALCHRWTGDHVASLVAGAAFTFNTQSLMRLEHLQAAHAYGLPLALLAADRLIETGSRRDVIWLAVWMVVMAYTSGYLVVFASVALAVLLVARVGVWRRRPANVIGGFTAAAILTGAAALPVYLPYRRVAIEQAMVRTLDGVTQFSATLDGYAASYSRLHEWLWKAGRRRESPEAFFPGVTVSLLTLIGVTGSVWFRRARQENRPAVPLPGEGPARFPPANGRLVWFPPSGKTPPWLSPSGGISPRLSPSSRTPPWFPPSGGTPPWLSPSRGTVVIALIALAVTGCVLSLGTHTPVYGWLYAIFPPMSGVRAAARFGGLFLLAVAMLAGIGLALLRAGLSRRTAAVVGVAALLLVTIEAARAPIRHTPFEGIPGIYRLLAGEPGAVVLVEVPFYPPEAIFQNAEYVLNSTAHWRPLMNGYSGYTPATYRELSWPFWNFPAAWSIDAMRAAGVTHLVVHPARFEAEGDAVLRAALANPHLERLAVSRGNLTLFRLR